MISNQTLENYFCKNCESVSFRSPVVISRGNPESKLMLIGEAPGAKEEEPAPGGSLHCGIPTST